MYYTEKSQNLEIKTEEQTIEIIDEMVHLFIKVNKPCKFLSRHIENRRHDLSISGVKEQTFVWIIKS